MNIVLRASVKKGELLYENPMAYHKLLVSISGLIEVVFRKVSNPRTNQQNKLYWKWMTILGEEIGYTKEEMHFIFKKQFLADKMSTLQKDEFMEYLQGLSKDLATTKKLSIGGMVEYMNKVFDQARELGYRLPLPDDLKSKGGVKCH